MAIVYLYDESAREYARSLIEKIDPSDVKLQLLSEGESDSLLPPEAGSHLLVSGSVATIKRVLHFAAQHHRSVGILPLPDQGRLSRVLTLPKDPAQRWAMVSRPAEKPVDLLYCNDALVLSDVRIGENALLKSYEFESDTSGWSRYWDRWIHSWRDKAHLGHHPFTLRTDKDESITLSATGLIALNYSNDSWVGRALRQELSATDGQLALLALAPTSLFEFFISYPIRVMWRRWRHTSALPATWGYLKTSRVTVESPEPLEVVVDDTETLTTPVTLRIEPASLFLSVGETFWSHQSAPKATRNTQRLSGVPRDEERMKYFEKGLPLFAHASQEEYATLFGTLREETRLSWTFAILLILSTVLATLGLFINSASVIIGAMLLAPLMQPIVGLSMGVLRRDTGLLISGARSIIVGVGLVLASAMTIAWLTPMHELGSEMAARLSPTILDLLVAITSGIAAAYAKNNSRISGSLVGVAIAVALVPPLSVSGIGIGWGNGSMFANAMLLFATNLVGIVLAASLTFFVLGFSPIRIARRGMMIWGAVALLIAIPLSQSFEHMRQSSRIRQALSQLRFEYNGQKIALGRVEYLPHGGDAGHRPQVRCEVIVDRTFDKRERTYIREMIAKVVGQPTETIVTVRYRL